MALYVIQARGADQASLERATIIKDGFSWPAFIFAQLWLIYHRLWLALLIWVLAEVAFILLVLPHIAAGTFIAVDGLAHLFIGFEGNRLRLAKGARRAEAGRRRRRARPRRGGGPFLRPILPAGTPLAWSPTLSVAIIDYGSGNLHSAFKAVERAAREAGLSEEPSPSPPIPTSWPRPSASSCRASAPSPTAAPGSMAVPGLVAALNEAVQVKGRPFFGICVGMQLMATRGLENGETAGLDWIAGEVDAITPSDPDLKIPHMGWNTLDAVRTHPVFDGVPTGPDGLHAYFVHSYGFRAASNADVVATTDYAGPIAAVDRQGHDDRHPVSSREKPGARPRPARQFPAMASVILYPAIDLKAGQCVRLKLGDMAQATVFNDDPAAQAAAFEAQGFSYLHVVDLDGAFAGKPMNAQAVDGILARCQHAGAAWAAASATSPRWKPGWPRASPG